MARQITTVLIDLSGTLHIDNTAIPGAVQALNRLDLFYFFVSFFLLAYVLFLFLLFVCTNYTNYTITAQSR